MPDPSDGLLREPDQSLDVQHHDDPQRHLIGRTLLAPQLTKPLGDIANIGISDAPAREDHIHAFSEDIWHYVGGTNEPVFQNSWVNLGGGWQPLRFRKFGDMVYVEGHIQSGVNAAIIFTLPVGYRPPNIMRRVVTQHGTVIGEGYCDTKPNGDVNINTDSGTIGNSALSYWFGLTT